MRSLLLLPALLLAAHRAPAATVPAVFGGRLPCVVRDGVQFCEGSLAVRTESWDGVPLDANVTLPPPEQDGPFPLVVELHGWSAGKVETPYVDRAERGYVVLSYTARGFHQSCGLASARLPDATLANPTVCAERGWTHLADARYEIRDTQWLAGLLVDDGLVDPARVGVTGVSYGGGQSMILAALRDRTMLPDGTLVPWTSRGGRAMTLAAAAPVVPWTDMAEVLAPAGRTLDHRTDNPYGPRAGIQKQSWVELLYASGIGSGFFAPPGADPSADLTGWTTRIAAGEPYDGDSAIAAIIEEVTSYHSAYYVDASVAPAPLFIYNAWTDDLFPADEALRFWRRLRAAQPGADVALAFADGFGHPRASLAAGNIAHVFSRIEAFLDRHLKGMAVDPPPRLEVFTQGCNGAAEAGPFVADDWDAIHPGEIRWSTAKTRRFDQRGGDADVAIALDPLNGGPCRTLPATDDPGAATYLLPVVKGDGYTLLGAPTVVAELAASGSFAQVAARLWDVAPDGRQTLVSHALYRPRSDALAPQPFQLHPNGWHFAAGHRPKLELLGQSPPYGRAATGEFVVVVRRLELRLPVREAPDGRVVRAPAPAVLPPAAAEPPDTGPPPCPVAPSSDCAAAAATRIEWGADRLRWRWSGQAPDLGDPRTTTAYRLCVYGADGTLAVQASLPAGGICGTAQRARPCWRTAAKSARYDDPSRTPDGVRRLVASAVGRRKGKLVLEAGGEHLTLPPARPASPLRVQLSSSRGRCWSGSPALP